MANQEKEQLDMMLKLRDVMNDISDEASDFSKAISSQTDAMKRLHEQMNSKDFKDYIDNSKELNEKILGDINDKLEDQIDDMTDFEKAVTKAGQSVKKHGVILGGFIGTLSGLKSGLTGSIAMMHSLGSAMFTVAGAAFKLGISIISIPFKMYKGLLDEAVKYSGGDSSLLQAIENIRKSFGDLAGQTPQAIRMTVSHLAGFRDTGLSAWRVFGNLAERLEYMLKMAEGMGPTFQVLRNEFEDNGGAILAYQKALGFAEDEMKGLGQRAITMGQPMSKVFNDLAKQTLGLGKAFDLDQKIIGRDVGKAMKDVGNFGQLAVKEIAQASVYTKKLGVELDKVVGTLGKFETFDSAAEAAANLSQSFGVTVDAFKMMSAQNPAEQLDMLRKSFKEAGVDSSQFSRQQLKLISQQTGLDEATAKQVFSLKNYGSSLDDIKKKSEGSEKKTMTQTEAMQNLAASIERLVKSGGDMGPASFFQQFFRGFKVGIVSTREFAVLMRNIRWSLRLTFMEGIKLGREFTRFFPGVHDFLKNLAEMFSPKRIVGFFAYMRSELSGTIHALANGDVTIVQALHNIMSKFRSFMSLEGSTGMKVLESANRFWKNFVKIAKEGMKWAIDQTSEGLKLIAWYLTNPKQLTTPAAGGISKFGSWVFDNVIKPAIDIGKYAWDKLLPPLMNIIQTLIMGVTKRIEGGSFDFVFKALGSTILLKIVANIVTSATSGIVSGALTTAAAAMMGAKGIMGQLFEKVKNVKIPSGSSKGIGEVANAAASTKDLGAAGSEMGKMNIGMIAKGALVVGAVALLVTAIAGLTYLMFKGADPAKLSAIGKYMISMTGVIAGAGLIALEAIALGAIVTNPVGLIGAAGLAAIGAVVLAISGFAALTLAQIDKIPAGPEFESKTNIFINLMNSIVNLSKEMGSILGALNVSFTDWITGTNYVEKVSQAKKFIEAYIGDDNSGIIGIVKTLITSLRQISVGGAIESAVTSAASIFNSVTQMVVALKPSDEFFKAVREIEFTNRTNKTQSNAISDYIRAQSQQIEQLAEASRGIINTLMNNAAIAQSSGIKPEMFNSISGIFNSVVNLITSLKPSDQLISQLITTETVGEKGKMVEKHLAKFDPKTYESMLTSVLGVFRSGIPELINGVLGSIQGVKLDVNSMQKIDMIGKVLKSATDLINAIKPNEITVQSSGKGPTEILANVSNIDTVLKTFGSGFGDMFMSIKQQINQITTGDFGTITPQNIQMFTNVMNSIKPITDVINVLKGMPTTGGQNVQTQIETMMISLANIAHFGRRLGSAEYGTNNLMKDVVTGANNIKSSGLIPALDGLQKTVDAISRVSKMFDGENVSVDTKLKKIAEGIGIKGKKYEFQIAEGRAQLTVNLTVTMKTDEVEKVILENKQSIIRDRLNFAAEQPVSPTQRLPENLNDYQTAYQTGPITP